MKIVMFIENIQHGGLDTFCSTLLNAWPDERDRFTVVYNASHPGGGELRRAVNRPCEFVTHEIPLSWVLARRWFGWLPAQLRRLAQPFLRVLLYRGQYRALRRLLAQCDADALLVVNGGYPGGETCRIANIAWADMTDGARRARSIHNFHNMAVAPRTGFQWFENRIDSRLARATGKLVSVSRSCAESLRTRPVFRQSASIRHIYNGIAEQAPAGGGVFDLRRELGIPAGAPLCLILANYEPRKGHRFLFEAFALAARALPGAHLVACGGGSPEERAVVDAARREVAPGANIHLLGFVPGGAELIGQADVLAISSQSFESFGLTAVEAMRRRVPVVSTNVGGLPEVLGTAGEGGHVVAPDDVAGFAHHLVQLLGDPELRRTLGAAGQQRAGSLFTAQRMAAQYRDVLLAAPE